MPDYRLGIRTEVRDDATRPLGNINRALGDLGDAAETGGERGDAALRDLERAADRAGRSNSLDNVSRELDQIGRDAEQMARDGKESFNQLERAGDGFDLKGARDEIDKTAGAFAEFKEGLSLPTLGAGFLGGMAGGLVAGGIGAIAGSFSAATEDAADTETATKRLETQLHITEEAAAQYRDTAREMYLGVYGDSQADNIQALATTEMIMRRLGGERTQDELQRVAEQALGIQDAFGSDMADNVRAAVSLMDSFGVTSDQAMGFILTGFQRGLDSSGDFLDSIGEYSNQFAAGGADLGEFFSVMETGLAGGVLGTDKIADAFKEFQIIILSGSKDSAQALDVLEGTITSNFVNKIRDGSTTMIEGFAKVVAGLATIDDPILRAKTAVKLFGTQAEDTTTDVLLGVNTQKTGMDELEASVNDLGLQYDTSTVQVETAFRKWELAMVPFATSWNTLYAGVVSGAAEMVTAIGGAATGIIEWYNGLPEPLRLFLFGGAGASLAIPGGAPSFSTVAPGGAPPPPAFGRSTSPGADNPLNIPFGQSASPAAPNLITRPVSGGVNLPGVPINPLNVPAGWIPPQPTPLRDAYNLVGAGDVRDWRSWEGAGYERAGGGSLQPGQSTAGGTPLWREQILKPFTPVPVPPSTSVTIHQTFNGPANADDARQGVIDAARRAGLR